MNKTLHKIFALIILCLACVTATAQDHARYVDPRIGSEGLGRTFPGPSMPYGMVKPSPDGLMMPNAGWCEMPGKIKGFTQTHVSGTGGGQKYGNVLIQPYLSLEETEDTPTVKFLLPDGKIGEVELLARERATEDIQLGYYTCTYTDGIKTEITTAERCALYRITYPQTDRKKNWQNALFLDCASFLGMDTIPDKRETQQFVGSSIRQKDKKTLVGYSRVRGGWNNGGPYTVYFCMKSDQPLRDITLQDSLSAHLFFSAQEINLKIGISFVSVEQAEKNIVSTNFAHQRDAVHSAWNRKLLCIDMEGTEQQKRVLYTALYHTMLMPTDKSGENPHFSDTPYYDDYYAIWDTYRTSMPLLTLIDHDRQRDMVNALLNIYKHDGYLPDARSGNWNGRTQGGSNAEIVIADAFAKGMKGIDYELALQAMIKDAEVEPADAEKHGRGGVKEYNSLGYLPYGIDRAGNRTVEYSYDDWCIAEVAKGLGYHDLYEKYHARSGNWRNLWRSDYEWQGMKGFIMPKDANGQWLDSVPWGRSQVYHPTIPYKPDTKVAPWYLPWWSTFFYEALSAEYSLSIPHDVPGLIEACGGKEAFVRRLDTFFAHNHYNVANEPSFMTPYLYHWAGMPEKSSERIRQILNDNYNDTPLGLPGNDDSGAMSSWLVFNMLGLYPVAGQNLYIVGSPTIPSYTLHLPNGNDLTVRAEGDAWQQLFVKHEDLMKGGTLTLPKHEKTAPSPRQTAIHGSNGPMTKQVDVFQQYKVTPQWVCHFTLNRQYRNWNVGLDMATCDKAHPLSASKASGTESSDTLRLFCNQSVYNIPKTLVQEGQGFCWDSPQKGQNTYSCEGTFLFISRQALETLRSTGSFVYNGITWRRTLADACSITVQADVDGTLMRIATTEELPWVLEMKNNPLGIDWWMEEK